MIFHSLDFAAFFLIVVTIYWRLPHRAQNLLLLAASYLFYGWVHPWFVAIMLASTTVDYWAGQRMEDDPARKRRYLIASLAVNLGMLGVFKYFNFFVENVRDVLAAVGLTCRRRCSSWRCRRASRSTRSRRSATPSTSTRARCGPAATRWTSRCSSPSSRTWSPGRSCGRRNLLVQVEQPRVWDADRPAAASC